MARIDQLNIGLTSLQIANIGAFLDMIAWSEGTSRIPTSDDGYNVLVGSTPNLPHLFDGYEDHPRKIIKISPTLSSSAAGRYQLLSRYFDAYKAELKLNDFSPEAQDKIALQQIKECKAYFSVQEGKFVIAVALCARIWASLPGATYGQHTNKISDLQTHFVQCGGTVAV